MGCGIPSNRTQPALTPESRHLARQNREPYCLGAMPWWSIIYLVLFLLVVVVGTWLEVRERGGDRPMVLVLDAVSAIICAYLFASYWVSSWRQPHGAAAPLLFVLAAGWQIYDTPRGLRNALAEPEFSDREKHWLLAGVIAFFLPAYVVAGVAAFK
jgi:hypothetical protein